MANRIRDIFSDDRFSINGKIRFQDEAAYTNFVSALEMVRAEEVMIPVDGVVSISTNIEQSGMVFPLPDHKNIAQFVVATHKEPITIPVTFNLEERKITLYRTKLEDKIIVRSQKDSVIDLLLECMMKEEKLKFTYKVHLEKAMSVGEIAYDFESAFAFISTLFPKTDYEPKGENEISLSQVLWYFQVYGQFFRRLQAVENELEMSINPEKLNNLTREDQHDIDEVYLLLCKKQILRRKIKLHSMDSISIPMIDRQPVMKVGSKILLSYSSEIIFSFLGEEKKLFGANQITNAVVTDIQQESDGSSKILYGDTDDEPMHIAYSAFKTAQEAQEELKTMLEHENDYIAAKTYSDYAKEFYPPIK